MKVSLEWLQSYFEEKLPEADKLAEVLTLHAFEVEDIENVDGNVIFDIDVLPNRANTCLSHYYIAKEIAALTGCEIKPIPYKKLEIEDNSKDINVTIIDSNKCRRYSAQMMTGIKVMSSPEWLKNRLEALGQRSINNVVDATNYLMLSLNQPLHAFDLDKIEGSQINVRNSNMGEKFTTLDDVHIELTGEELVIADAHVPLALAGIKGGKHAQVDESTKNILIEGANFDASLIRQISKQLGIRTDSSKRFENNLSPELVGNAINIVTTLIQEIAGGKIGNLTDVYPKMQRDYKIGVSVNEVNNHLGTKLSEKEIEEILNKLQFTYEKVVPLNTFAEVEKYVGKEYVYGASITNDAPDAFDCSSLISYIYVNAGIAIPRMAVDQFVCGDEVSDKDMRVGDLVFSNTGEGKVFYKSIECMPGTNVENGVDHCGMYIGEGKVIHATRVEGKVIVEGLLESKQFSNQVGIKRYIQNDKEERYVITVPSERMDLRNPGGFLKGGNKEDIIEEIGRMYGYINITPDESKNDGGAISVNKLHYYEEKIREVLTNAKFSEIFTSSFSEKGKLEVANPIRDDRPYMRPNLADNISEILAFNEYNKDLLGLSEVAVFEIGTVFEGEREHKSCAIALRQSGKMTGKTAGEIEFILKKINVEVGVTVNAQEMDGIYEFDIHALIEDLPEPKDYRDFNKKETILYKKVSQYPFVLRDIALWVPKDVEGGRVEEILKRHGTDLLVRTTLFDRFEKEERVSIAYRLVFLSHEKTLSDDEINSIMKTITTNLNNVEKWEVR